MQQKGNKMSVPADPDKVKYDGHSQAMGHAYNNRERGVYLPYDLVAAIGGWTQAVVYKHIAYWFTKMGRPIYKGAPELAEELHLSESTVKRAVAELRRLGLITTEVRQANSAPTNHFRVHYEREAELLSEWRNGRPEPSGQNEPNDRVKMSRTITESTNREYKHLNPSSSDDDRGHASSSLKPSTSKSRADDSSLSENVRVRGNKKLSLSDSRFLELLPALADAWNDNCGRAPKLAGGTVAQGYRKNLLKLVNELFAEDEDPVLGIAYIARTIATIDSYANGTYGFANATRPDNWRSHYDSGKRRFGSSLQPLGHGLSVGQRVSWLSNPNMPFSRRYYGHVSELLEGGAVAIQVEPNQPGLHYNPSNMNPERLTVEDE
jgi:hypothetical protein